MALPRWDPLRDLLSLQERMNRLFEEGFVQARLGVPGADTWQPPADVFETERSFVVLIDLPGCTQDSLALEAGPHRVTVQGLSAARAARPERFLRAERSQGKYKRSFNFASRVEPTRMVCRFLDGVLRIEIPKAASRRIEIETP